MHTLADLARIVNRSRVYLSGLQTRFELPVAAGAGYSKAYLAFIQTLVHLRTLAVSEEKLRDLWHIEKKLLQLLHADSTGSPTWFLDSCGVRSNSNRRLLLSNYDLGGDVGGIGVQLGLDFAKTPPELFCGQEMGEDALRIFNEYRHHFFDLRTKVKAELPHLRTTMRWAAGRLRNQESDDTAH